MEKNLLPQIQQVRIRNRFLAAQLVKKDSFKFAAPAVDISISREMGNSGATSSLPNSTCSNFNGSDSELGTSTFVLGLSAPGLPLRAFRSGPSAPGLPLRIFRSGRSSLIAAGALRPARRAEGPQRRQTRRRVRLLSWRERERDRERIAALRVRARVRVRPSSWTHRRRRRKKHPHSASRERLVVRND